MRREGSQPVAVSCLDLFSFLWHSSWAHWMSSVAPCLVELHTFKCCDLCYLEELSVHLRVNTGLCSAVLVVAVVECHHHFNVTVICGGEAVLSDFGVVLEFVFQ